MSSPPPTLPFPLPTLRSLPLLLQSHLRRFRPHPLMPALLSPSLIIESTPPLPLDITSLLGCSWFSHRFGDFAGSSTTLRRPYCRCSRSRIIIRFRGHLSPLCLPRETVVLPPLDLLFQFDGLRAREAVNVGRLAHVCSHGSALFEIAPSSL